MTLYTFLTLFLIAGAKAILVMNYRQQRKFEESQAEIQRLHQRIEERAPVNRDPTGDIRLLETLAELGQRSLVDVDANHLTPAQPGQLHGLRPLAAADVQDPWSVKCGQQRKGLSGVFQSPHSQFLDAQCLFDIHRWPRSYQPRRYQR